MSSKIREEKFKVIQFVRELIMYIDKNLENFPKKDIELKNRLRNNSYDLLEIMYLANSSKNIEKKTELLEEVIAKVKVIDFLINLCYEKEIINGKKYMKFGSKIDDILKYTLGWIKTLNGHS